jgi:uncharacterized protein (TIGR00730 family)
MTRVCVFAGSNAGRHQAYAQEAAALGRLLASRGIGVVFGGGKVGLMGILADAAMAAGGEVIGVIPSALVSKEIAHDRLTELRVVQSMHERKAMMAELSDAFIALPGGWGTLEELFEVITWAQLGLHRKPCGLLNAGGYFDPLLTFLTHAVAEGFVREQHAGFLLVGTSGEALLEGFAGYEPPVVRKWIDERRT